MKSATTNRRELEARLKKLERQYQETIRQRARLILSYGDDMLSDETEDLMNSIRLLDKSAAEIQTDIKTIKGALK